MRPSDVERRKPSRKLCLDNLGSLWTPMELRTALEEHVSDLEVRHDFNLWGSSAWELVFGHGRPYGAALSGNITTISMYCVVCDEVHAAFQLLQTFTEGASVSC